MVNEEELDMWLAEESAYAQMGMSEEYSDFPDGEGGEGGQFNPSAA
jgi:hypothetical protein